MIAAPAYDLEKVRADFPILSEEVRGQPIAYLDNAASSQKPRAVLDAVDHVYETGYANIHRGVHVLSERATEHYERSRRRMAKFIGAQSADEVIFVRGTTEGLNLVASSLGRYALREGDEVLLTGMEHHSNIVPWQMVADLTGAKVLAAPVTDRGELDMDGFAALLSDRTRIVSVVHVSNALGTVNPVDEIARLAKERGAYLVLDGAQAAPHLKLDMQELGCDFYCLSGHKMYGPSGIGVLWGKKRLLEAIPPYQGGGEMIRTVSFERTTYAEPPAKFEAGTPNIAGPAGLAAAADYLDDLGIPEVAGTRRGSASTRSRASPRSPACGWWERRGRKPRWSPSWWTASTRTTSAPCSTRRASRCARGTTAPSRSWSVSGCRRRRGLPSASTTPKPRWTGWPPDSAPRSRSSARERRAA